MAEKILIISPVPIIPGYAGNRMRIRTICSEIMNMGYQLDFFYTGYEQELNAEHDSFFNGIVLDFNHTEPLAGNPATIRLKEQWNGLKIKFQKIKRRFLDGKDSASYNQSLFDFQNMKKIALLKEQISGKRYKAVIVNYAVYSFYFDLFKDKSLKILDLHDCLSDRYRMFTGQGAEPAAWYSLRPQDDKRAAGKADIIWAITGHEHEYYQNLTGSGTGAEAGNPRIYTLRHLERFYPIPSEHNRKTVLMIASDNRLNLDGLQWFLNEVWPDVLSQHSDAVLLVAGSVCKQKELFDGNQIEFFGRYEKDEDIYSKADICINPMRAGTGLKIKTLEALARNKLVLTAPAGASGLEDLVGNGLICHSSSSEWSAELCRLFDDMSRIAALKKGLEEAIGNIYKQNLSVIKTSVEYQPNL